MLMLETDDPRVNLTNGRFAARGYIRDNDGKYDMYVVQNT